MGWRQWGEVGLGGTVERGESGGLDARQQVNVLRCIHIRFSWFPLAVSRRGNAALVQGSS